MISDTLQMLAGKTPRWMRRALCTDSDPDLFFPEYGEPEKVQAAQRICAHCPVSRLCLKYALDRREPYGIFGGKTPQQRTYILKKRRVYRLAKLRSG